MSIIRLDRPEIEAILPHRGRALMLDRAEVDTDNNTAKGFFRITKEVCEGHLPGLPIFRGTDRIEVLFLTLALAVGKKLPKGKIAVATYVSGVSFRGIAKIGDEVRSEVRVTMIGSRKVIGYGSLHVGGIQICKASDLIGLIVPKSKFV